MATINVPLTQDWLALAVNTDDHVLISGATGEFEIAVTATDTAPTVQGHRIKHDEGINRALLGAGYVWARKIGPGVSILAVTKS